MEKFETLLNDYFSTPYRPEYFVKKLRDEIKNSNYNFLIVKESKNELIPNNFNTLFRPIFSTDKNPYDSYVFNDKVVKGESIENFKNFIYECCKLDYENINKKEILLYLFVLEEFKNRLVDAIYFTALNKKENDIYIDNLLLNFKSCKGGIKKNYFDKVYLIPPLQDLKFSNRLSI